MHCEKLDATPSIDVIYVLFSSIFQNVSKSLPTMGMIRSVTSNQRTPSFDQHINQNNYNHHNMKRPVCLRGRATTNSGDKGITSSRRSPRFYKAHRHRSSNTSVINVKTYFNNTSEPSQPFDNNNNNTNAMAVSGSCNSGSAGSMNYWPSSIPPSLNRKDRQILAHAGFNFQTNNGLQRSPKRNQNYSNNSNNNNNNNNNNNSNGKQNHINYATSRSNDPWKMLKSNNRNYQPDKAKIFAVLKKQMSCPFVETSPPVQLSKEDDRNRIDTLYSGARGLSVISSPAPLQMRRDSLAAEGTAGYGTAGKQSGTNKAGAEVATGGVAAVLQPEQAETRGYKFHFV